MELDKILKEDSLILCQDEIKLFKSLIKLHKNLRDYTKKTYNRINPFYEDLFDWKERGTFLFKDKKNITVYNSSTIVGDVKVGNNTWIGPFTSLDGTGGLEIGSFCSISAAVHILTHDSVKWALSGGKLNYEYKSVKIGDCCFIGVGAIITKGVKIGNRCLIGAGAVVTHDIPANSIVVGVPAKIKGKILINKESISFEY